MSNFNERTVLPDGSYYHSTKEKLILTGLALAFLIPSAFGWSEIANDATPDEEVAFRTLVGTLIGSYVMLVAPYGKKPAPPTGDTYSY